MNKNSLVQLDAIKFPEGWAFYTADFSLKIEYPARPGRVILRKVGEAYRAWHELSDEEKAVTRLYSSGTGHTLGEAILDASDIWKGVECSGYP